jgi:hypothetical protein
MSRQSKIFYIISCSLAATAIIADGAGKTYYSRALRIRCLALQEDSNSGSTEMQNTKLARQQSDPIVQIGNKLTLLGTVTAGLALISLIVSFIMGCRWTLVTPIVLFAAYIILFFCMV